MLTISLRTTLNSIMAANDVSSRKAQFATSQWSYSKGFDTSCPIGPVLVHKDTIKDWSKVQIEGKLNGKVVQKSDLGYVSPRCPLASEYRCSHLTRSLNLFLRYSLSTVI